MLKQGGEHLKTALLEVRNLELIFNTLRGRLKALHGVSFKIYPREILGLVGESGSGKTITGLSIMGLLDPTAEITRGEILFEGKDLLKLSEEERIKLRGKEISIIFQEPRAALNPVMNVGDQIAEAVLAHSSIDKEKVHELIVDFLVKVGLPDPWRIMRSYPHELSGGMAQRIMIAMALILKPKLLIADEPTSALDVTIQAQILDLIKELVKELGTSVLFITHDLALAAELVDRIAVMYAGTIVERGSVEEIFEEPLHPYTKGLLTSIPRLGYKGRLYSMKGEIPSLLNVPPGCKFYPRCPYSMKICKTMPNEIKISDTHSVACYLYEGD